MQRQSFNLFGNISSTELNRLIEKYSGAGPRYTSYPTAVEFSSAVGPSQWLDCLRADVTAQDNESSERAGYSLYFHLPFCKSLCYFCACNKVITRDTSVVPPYLNALLAEIQTYKSVLGSDISIEQIHWGGGSPNFFSAAEMEHLHEATLNAFPNLSKDAEVSLEIDPRETTAEQLTTLVQMGFNRLSMGVQDFDPEVQELINRIQPFELTKAICKQARAVGFSGLNIDLIYGLPNQTVDKFKDTVDSVLELRPERVALYGYAHVTWIKKVQKALERAHLPTPQERIEIFLEALKKFTEAGYIHIGLDHFALPSDDLALALKEKRLNRNFMGYTTHKGARLIGMGASAISTLPDVFAQNVKDISRYQELVLNNGFATERGLKCSIDDRQRQEIIEEILCQGAVDFSSFESRWGINVVEHYRESLDALSLLAEDDLVEFDSRYLRLTPVGELFARSVAMTFDAYLAGHQSAAKPVFSQAV